MNDQPIITSLLEQDLYKFSMTKAILHWFPGSTARFDFKCRSDAKLGHLKPEIDRQLDSLCELRFTRDELDYLQSIPWLSGDYIDYLERFYLKRDQIHTDIDGDGQLVMWAEGPWRDISFFEIPCLAIVSETNAAYSCECLGLSAEDVEKHAAKRLHDDIQRLKMCRLEGCEFTFADFGLRRRFGGDWHRKVVRDFAEIAPELFVGTSDVLLAKEFGIKPIGTFAHEWLGGLQCQDFRLANAQKAALDIWAKEYRGELGIALSDNYGFRAFLRDFDKYFAKLFDGCRHDSGNPFIWGEMLIEHYRKLGIDPRTKIGCWSDSLDADRCVEIARRFCGRIKVSFGVGTSITNNTGLVEPLNMVMKMTECNGHPVAKLSDAPGKGMCRDAKYVDYLKEVYQYRSIDEPMAQ